MQGISDAQALDRLGIPAPKGLRPDANSTGRDSFYVTPVGHIQYQERRGSDSSLFDRVSPGDRLLLSEGSKAAGYRQISEVFGLDPRTGTVDEERAERERNALWPHLEAFSKREVFQRKVFRVPIVAWPLWCLFKAWTARAWMGDTNEFDGEPQRQIPPRDERDARRILLDAGWIDKNGEPVEPELEAAKG